MENRISIGVAGNIGVGKSTICTYISKAFIDSVMFPERVNTKLLNKYYKDKSEFGYKTQMYFISSKFVQMTDMEESDQRIPLVIQDRTIYEDAFVFSYELLKQGHITEDEYKDILSRVEVYDKLFLPLDLLVYLEADVDVLKERIRGRIEDDSTRQNEMDITRPEDTYLANLKKWYDVWFDKYEHKKIKIDTNNLDLPDKKVSIRMANNKVIQEQVINKIIKELDMDVDLYV